MRLPGCFESGATRSSSRVADRAFQLKKGVEHTIEHVEPALESRHLTRAAALAEEFDDEHDAQTGVALLILAAEREPAAEISSLAGRRADRHVVGHSAKRV